MSDECRPVEVDGEIIRVRGEQEMTALDRDAFAEVIRAARRKFFAEDRRLSAEPFESWKEAHESS